jgi:hypothetical protein
VGLGWNLRAADGRELPRVHQGREDITESEMRNWIDDPVRELLGRIDDITGRM